MDDNQIIELFFDRSETALEAASKKYGGICRHIATNLLGSSQDAEECVNDTYHALWNTIPPARPNPLVSYIARITRNLALKKRSYITAAKRSVVTVPLDELSGCLSQGPTPQQILEARELTQLLDRFLDTLDQDNRAMFLRRYWFFDSIEVIARGFGISQSAVKSRLFRMREQLKVYLKEAQIYV